MLITAAICSVCCFPKDISLQQQNGFNRGKNNNKTIDWRITLLKQTMQSVQRWVSMVAGSYSWGNATFSLTRLDLESSGYENFGGLGIY